MEHCEGCGRVEATVALCKLSFHHSPKGLRKTTKSPVNIPDVHPAYPKCE
jgi:hypothetical protein